MRCVALAFLTAVSVLAAPVAQAFDLSKARPHVAFNLGSYHHNASRNFEETNPGIGFGLTAPTGWHNSEAGIEAGQYRNSVGGHSFYVMGSLDVQVAELTPRANLRLGVFGGAAHYAGSTAQSKRAGVPSIGDWVLAAGGQATVRFDDRTDLRVRIMPAGNVADALVTVQLAVRF